MPGQGVLLIAAGEKARVAGEQVLALTDPHLLGVLVDGDVLAEVALGHRVAVRIQRDVADDIDDPLVALVDRRRTRGQRLEVRLLDQIGGLGLMPSARFTLRLACSVHQVRAWALRSAKSRNVRPARKFPSI